MWILKNVLPLPISAQQQSIEMVLARMYVCSSKEVLKNVWIEDMNNYWQVSEILECATATATIYNTHMHIHTYVHNYIVRATSHLISQLNNRKPKFKQILICKILHYSHSLVRFCIFFGFLRFISRVSSFAFREIKPHEVKRV